MNPLRTFLVEDNPVISRHLVSTLEELGPVQVIGQARSESQAVAWLMQPPPCDLMIIDIVLASGSGLGVLQAAQACASPMHRVVLTNHATPALRQRCLALGAQRVFDKSCELEALIAWCEELGHTRAP